SQIKKLLTDMGEMGRAAGIGEPRRGGPRTLIARGKSAAELRALVNELPDNVKASIRVSSSSTAAPAGFQVWDFSEEAKGSEPGSNASPRSGGSGAGVGIPAGLNRNRSTREFPLPPGLTPEGFQR